MTFVLFALLVIILAIVIGWHVIFAILGGAIVIGAAVWGIAIVSIVVFCFAVLLLFLFTGIGTLIIGSILVVWTLIAILLSPILLPILLPLLIVFGFICYTRRKKRIDRISAPSQNRSKMEK